MTVNHTQAAVCGTTGSVQGQATELVTQPSRAERRRAAVRRAGQRGMVTAEYAVGILAAIALALVLLKVVNDNEFFTVLLKQVTALIGQMSKSLG